jgi:hypothetical protein
MTNQTILVRKIKSKILPQDKTDTDNTLFAPLFDKDINYGSLIELLHERSTKLNSYSWLFKTVAP